MGYVFTCCNCGRSEEMENAIVEAMDKNHKTAWFFLEGWIELYEDPKNLKLDLDHEQPAFLNICGEYMSCGIS